MPVAISQLLLLLLLLLLALPLLFLLHLLLLWLLLLHEQPGEAAMHQVHPKWEEVAPQQLLRALASCQAPARQLHSSWRAVTQQLLPVCLVACPGEAGSALVQLQGQAPHRPDVLCRCSFSSGCASAALPSKLHAPRASALCSCRYRTG